MNKLNKGWRKLLGFVLMSVIVLSFMASCSNTNQQPNNNADADKGEIKIGYVNWAECVAVSNLWQVILEDKGYQVELIQLDAAPLFVGLNKGDVDFFMDAWLPITHETYWNEYKDNLEDYGVWYEGEAKIGVVVPNYVTIDSINQLKDEAAKFDNKIIGIDPGAGIMKASEKANESYGLGFEIVQGSEAAMMAAMDKAYGKNEWIAITGWSPHWMFAKYDLKYLEDPNGDFGEAEELHILANKDFSSKQAGVVDVLKKFKMTDAQIGSLEALINEGMEPKDAAKKWIDDNRDLVEGWLN
ncbi:MAG: glycine betaine ABC transporter substrate-binding protein [Clostridia bacterium]|jgi:glycine betaine/proline transport system substrate-binding protein|nr:glycine betaine ABC transporter substrate-binding protein [Clostridia bacterium]MDD4572197.1 glycine betaine ABC transporter substrate-binding protein [Clostridia bacterium]